MLNISRRNRNIRFYLFQKSILNNLEDRIIEIYIVIVFLIVSS